MTTQKQNKITRESVYDVIVIGSGPGGQRASIQAAKLGHSVLLIEKDNLGGACLHTGTIPSKTLREAALEVTGGGSSNLTHENAAHRNYLESVMRRTREVIQDESQVIEEQLQRNKVEYVQGHASFANANTLQINTARGVTFAEGKKIIIATGTRPRRPAGFEFDSVCVFDSDDILEIREQPRTMAVIGAGVIGCEYASIYAAMGVKVTLIDARPELLKSIDQEIVSSLLKHFQKVNIELCLGYDFADIQASKTKTHHGRPQAQVHLRKKDPAHTGPMDARHLRNFDTVLCCLGRTGNVETLHLAAAGLSSDERGLITVNSNYQTQVPSIYAVGDVIGAPALAASSAEQGRLAVLHAIKGQLTNFPDTFPYGIYTIPEISSVGIQESELRLIDANYVSGIAHYAEIARGKILADDTGFLKILVERETQRILGVHVIGTNATELVHIGQVAMAFGAKIGFFVDNVFNYPTLAEAYKVAAFNAINKLNSTP